MILKKVVTVLNSISISVNRGYYGGYFVGYGYSVASSSTKACFTNVLPLLDGAAGKSEFYIHSSLNTFLCSIMVREIT